MKSNFVAFGGRYVVDMAYYKSEISNSITGGRQKGNEIQKDLKQALGSGVPLILNFSGVDIVSNCLLDEALCKLGIENITDFGKKISFIGCSDFVRMSIKAAIKDAYGSFI